MSGNGDLRVQNAALEGAASDLVRAAKQINGDLDGLESSLSSMKSSWEGSAQEAYIQAKTQWDNMMRDMIQVLEGAAGTVRDSGAAYQATDRRGASRFA